MMKSRAFKMVAATLAALTISIGVAQAAPNDATTTSQFIPALKQLAPQLSLTPTQQNLWQTAMDTMQESHVSARMNEDQLQQQIQAAEQQPIIDLRAVHAAHLKVEQEDDKLREQSANAWITFYESLNNQQKTSVSAVLAPQFQAIAQHPGKPYEPRTGL
jgi:periplasmic protein CpxP/Spy